MNARIVNGNCIKTVLTGHYLMLGVDCSLDGWVGDPGLVAGDAGLTTGDAKSCVSTGEGIQTDCVYAYQFFYLVHSSKKQLPYAHRLFFYPGI
jgi:hypothetical protein